MLEKDETTKTQINLYTWVKTGKVEQRFLCKETTRWKGLQPEPLFARVVAYENIKKGNTSQGDHKIGRGRLREP